ncbi:MAG: NAD-dependent epimerase/dehydratase family protein [Planctomycetota bacterium]
MDFNKAFNERPVLITGARGFMGSYLAVRLAKAGARLSLLLRPGKQDHHPGRPDLPAGAACMEADIRDKASIDDLITRVSPSVIIHLAAFTDVRRDPRLRNRCFEHNLTGALNVAEAAMRRKVDRMVQLGTCEEYGDHQAPFTEDLPPRPVSPYSESKAEATQSLLALHKKEGLPVVILRPFLAYGPGQHPDRFLNQAIHAALRGERLRMTPGEQTREFNHVEDLVEGIMIAAAAEGVDGEIINLASCDERKLLDVVKMIYRFAGSDLQPDTQALAYRAGEAMRFCGSVEKCRRLLDFRPRITLENGVQKLMEWERSRMNRKGRHHA